MRACARTRARARESESARARDDTADTRVRTEKPKVTKRVRRKPLRPKKPVSSSFLTFFAFCSPPGDGLSPPCARAWCVFGGACARSCLGCVQHDAQHERIRAYPDGYALTGHPQAAEAGEFCACIAGVWCGGQLHGRKRSGVRAHTFFGSCQDARRENTMSCIHIHAHTRDVASWGSSAGAGTRARRDERVT